MSQTIDSSARRQETLGRQLTAEKKTCRASGRIWRSYVKERFGLSRERADELIRIGEGFLSVKESRARKKEYQRKSRLRHKMLASAVIAQHVHRSKATRDKISESLTLRRFSKREIAEIEATTREVIAVWEDLLRGLGEVKL